MAYIQWEVTGSLANQWRAQIDQAINTASDYINSFLARPIDFDVSVTFAALNGAIATGGSDFTYLGGDSWEPIGGTQARTGDESDGFDSIITFDPAFLDSTYFGNGNVPANAYDGLSIFVHEMLHSIGFIGWTDWFTFVNTANAYTPFDDHIVVIRNEPYFSGVNVQALLGEPALLKEGSIFHLSDVDYPDDIINPYAPLGERFFISELDLAVLADLGMGTIRNDIFLNSPDAEDIDAGAGFDTFVYEHDRASYSVARNSDGSITVRGPDGYTDFLDSMDRIQFNDMSYVIDMQDRVAQISSDALGVLIDLYSAYFNRVPEASGLAYWIDQYAGGKSMNQIAAEFYQAGIQFSDVTGYSANMALSEFVGILYANVLDRVGVYAPTQSEIEYWIGEVKSGAVTREGLVAEFLHDARLFYGDPNVGYVPELLDNKVEFGRLHAVTYGIDYLSQEEAIEKTVDLAAAVTSTSIEAAVALVGLSDDNYI